MKTELLPDFLVIGAGKSGTTSLNEYLEEHPKIFMGRKEPNFFAFERINPDDYEDEESRIYYYKSVYTLEDYKALFKGAEKGQRKGEVSNIYLSSELASKQIKHYVPEAKMIVILRHPADRLLSRYAHLVREGEVPEGDFEDFFDRQSIWWKRQDLIDEGFYYKHLSLYFEKFPTQNIRVYLYENFINDTDAVMRDIFEFLGVDPSVKVGTDVVYNKSGSVKNKALHNLVGQNSGPILFLKKAVPGIHKWLKESVWANRLLNALRNKNLKQSEIPPGIRQRFIDEVYKDDIENLQKLLKKDLSHWL